MKLPFPGRLLALAVVSSLSLALPFSAAHAEDKPKVALVMKSLANEFFRTMVPLRDTSIRPDSDHSCSEAVEQHRHLSLLLHQLGYLRLALVAFCAHTVVGFSPLLDTTRARATA